LKKEVYLDLQYMFTKRMEEIKGSPFKTYGEAHLAIGLTPGSRAIGINIKTGKFFKGLYLFTSLPINK
jgi:hypothetical protein